MDSFTKKRFVTGIIVVLVILNISTLITIWFLQTRRPPLPPPVHERRSRDVEHFLEKELNLTEEQARKFKESRERHFEQRRVFEREIHRLRREINDEIFADSPDTLKMERLAQEIGANQVELEKLHFLHFQELKAVCDPEQKKKFRTLFHEMFRRIRPPEGHPPPGPRRK